MHYFFLKQNLKGFVIPAQAGIGSIKFTKTNLENNESVHKIYNMKDYNFFVYILFDERAKATYVGVTNNLERRMYEHKMGLDDGYTKEKNIHKLGYFEHYKYIDNAIAREKQLKKWKRAWKYRLIETMNPNWVDLADDLEQNISYWKSKEIS